MASPNLNQRLEIGHLAARSFVRTAGAAMGAAFRSRLAPMRTVGCTIRVVPSDLRSVDPGVFEELRSGHLGLAGTVQEIAGRSPFGVAPPTLAWARELHGFTWLGGLRAAELPEAAALARQLVDDWRQRFRASPGGMGTAADPLVAARRVTAWLTSSGFLLDGADDQFYSSFTRALALEIEALSAASRHAAFGYPKLACLLAEMLAGLSLAGRERSLPRLEARLIAELDQQLLPDGGHASRNPEVVADILIDLLPIRECYGADIREAPDQMARHIARMQQHLRSLVFESGELARFNGVTGSRLEEVATALAIGSAPPSPPASNVGASGYARLSRGATTLVVDCAPPPPLLFAADAHAGCLSFELEHAGRRIVANAGFPGRTNRQAAADARATASHSTLCLDDGSSARLLKSPTLDRLLGAPPLTGLERVSARIDERDGALVLVASHDGYLAAHGLVHERTLTLSADGARLEGCDRLRPPHGTLRLKRDLPVAVRFHLPPGTIATSLPDGRLQLSPASGPAWIATSPAARMTIEAATRFSSSAIRQPALQLVIRAATHGDTELPWCLERT